MSAGDVAPVIRVLVLLSLSIPSQCQSKSASPPSWKIPLKISIMFFNTSLSKKSHNFELAASYDFTFDTFIIYKSYDLYRVVFYCSALKMTKCQPL